MSRAVCLSFSMAWAVSAMMGWWLMLASARASLHVVQPSFIGRFISSKTNAGCSARIFCNASSPSPAQITACPARVSRLTSMSRFIWLSSTNRIVFAVASVTTMSFDCIDHNVFFYTFGANTLAVTHLIAGRQFV